MKDFYPVIVATMTLLLQANEGNVYSCVCLSVCLSTDGGSPCDHSTFSKTHKVGNNGINANFFIPINMQFFHYLDLNMLVNLKLDGSLPKVGKFQACGLYWSF